MKKQFNEHQSKLKQEFIETHGYWDETWEQILDMDPAFFEAYTNFSTVPWRQNVLPPKIKEFIYIAIHAATTNLHEDGLRQHMAQAIKCGANQEELLEVLEITAAIGVHALTLGAPTLFDELNTAGRGDEIAARPLSPREQEIKDEFIEKRGYWTELWNGILQVAPDFFLAYLKFSSVPWTTGVLEPKVKELIYIANDASTTHLYEIGLRVHIRNALKHGASIEEIMEVYQLASTLGVNSLTLGVPIMLEELAKAKKHPNQ